MALLPHLWQLYWETRRQRLQEKGSKGLVVAVTNQLIKLLQEQGHQPISIVTLGCGEGHILSAIREANATTPLSLIGIDIQADVIAQAKQFYPDFQFLVADYRDPVWRSQVGSVHLVLLVNSLHEVYSATRDPRTGFIAEQEGKQQVRQTLAHIAAALEPDGYLVLFDGLEHDLPGSAPITIQFCSDAAANLFTKFAHEYQAEPITFTRILDQQITLPLRHFTRFITKTLFLETPLWAIERDESYQYFTEREFLETLIPLGLLIQEIQRLSPHLEQWQQWVTLLTSDVLFPDEHILLVGQKTTQKIYSKGYDYNHS
ncbi:MAG: class I SAM-dependent methyltransferase [Chloroflexi bacterium]|nr:class I SAM-dependent methyltransferase [Chloroflexota bacterium]MBP8056002.1 class I SAM-dependent methyltransferase [Chloroflexota bacterium]